MITTLRPGRDAIHSVKAIGYALAIASLLVSVRLAIVAGSSPWLDRTMTAPMRIVAGAVVFLIVALLILTPKPIRLSGLGLHAVPLGKEIVGGAALFAIVVSLVIKSPMLLITDGSIAVFVAATTEEIVFRVLLPQQFLSRFQAATSSRSAAWLMSWLVSQAIFALCHLPTVSGHERLAVQEPIRLLVAGLLYGTLVITVGVWLAVAVHASLNFNLWFASAVAFPPSMGELALELCVALYLIAILRPKTRSVPVRPTSLMEVSHAEAVQF